MSLAGKVIYDETDNIFMVFTGSSSLNIEINVDASRRLLKIPIHPLNYKEHLSLKYGLTLDDTKHIRNMIFTEKIEDAKQCEERIYKKLINSQKIQINEWEDYLKYGGFPSSFYADHYIQSEFINNMVGKIVTSDLNSIQPMLNSNINALKIVKFLSLQKPGNISKGKLAEMLNISSSVT